MGNRLLFPSFFETSPQVCYMLSTQRPPNSSLNHLLWGILLLKTVQHRMCLCCPCWSTKKYFSKMVFNLC
jgi:hypothetical protein